MKDLITKIQEKPYETRLRILWSTIIGVALVLVVVFVFSIKSTLKGIDGKDLIKLNTNTNSTNAETAVPYASVERVERTEKILKIYFNFNNTTDDILSVSPLTDITLTYGDTSAKPLAMIDRQGNPFVQKILSHTQNFGVLTFTPINMNDPVLTFDNMYLEKNPSNVFQQKLNLSLSELEKNTQLRN